MEPDYDSSYVIDQYCTTAGDLDTYRDHSVCTDSRHRPRYVILLIPDLHLADRGRYQRRSTDADLRGDRYNNLVSILQDLQEAGS